MKQTSTFTLSPEVKQLIRVLAKEEGVSMASIIEMAVRYFAKSKRQPVTEAPEDKAKP